MSKVDTLATLDRRIAVARANLNLLIEQAAAATGSTNEERLADRIAQETEAIERLEKEREAFEKSS
ncbi:hypothetical protein [Pseudorhodoplanes sinuspersici]|uniref:Uncharacterized protein n=1 Tax=Pseudorhodoplanes sinuspersici TaxID=1235591 RepID=A0A1W6ZU87_9HYPH|nr:hypothetical protein [Pseudorhodoplanes sinuspersici]ARQ00325.1 hypothetical protein CAK95_15510 [Pseudorhodoplanes sinuspersici]RKE67515.1 hypothetical protein DFP91_5280 [Pseudorhodoplanes sinuspersici]